MAENKLYNFNLPSPYQAELSKIAEQRRMAEMLQAQSQAPLERFSYKGIEARIPKTAGLAKLLQGFGGAYLQNQAREEEKALGERYRGEQIADMTALGTAINAPAIAGQAAVPERSEIQMPSEELGGGPSRESAPAIPAVAGRAAGQIDPSIMGQMKTREGANQVLALVMAQRQAQIEAERRANEPYTLAEGAGRYQPMPGGQPAQLIAGGMPKTPFAPIDVLKVTQASLLAATNPDGTVDRTKLVAIPERLTGNLAELAVENSDRANKGLPPLSISQYREQIAKAGRTPPTPAQPRERFVYDAVRGGRVNLDTGKLMPITQGGVPIGAAPSPAVAKEVMGIQQGRSTMQGAINAVEASPTAFGLRRGAATASGSGVAESIAGRFDTEKETEARAYVYNNVSAVIKERAGTAQSAQELTRINSFLPGATDNATQIVNKLKGYLKYLDDLEAGTVGKPTQPTQPTTQTPIYANAPGKPRMMSTDGGKTWKEAK
jgi:hypothetical protein